MLIEIIGISLLALVTLAQQKGLCLTNLAQPVNRTTPATKTPTTRQTTQTTQTQGGMEVNPLGDIYDILS